MPGIPKPPEGMQSERKDSNVPTGWDTLQGNPADIEEEVQENTDTPVDNHTDVVPEPSEPEMYHGPLEESPLLALGNDLADARIFFSDAVDIAKYCYH